MRLPHQLLTVCLPMLISHLGVAIAQLPSPRANAVHTIDPRLSLILKANAEINQGTELKETMAWIENLHSAPACTQLASSKLVADCQLLDDPTEFAKVYPDQVLEYIQNEYALKLAMCEYVGAQHASRPPPKCHAFLPSKEACAKRSWLWGHTEPSGPGNELCYPKTTKTDLTQCLATMQSSPQTWTSYSNAMNRAMQICHLSRHHIEKEEALRLYKNLTLVVSKLHESVLPLESKLRAMEDQLHTWSDDTRHFFAESQQAAESFTQFAQEAQRQHRDQLRETNQSLRSMQSEVAVLQQKANEHYNALNAKFESRMEASLATGVDVVTRNQADALAHFTANIGLVYQSLTKELSGQFERYNAELQEYHEKSMLAIQQQHKTAVQSFDIISTGMGSVQHNVDNLNEKTSTLKTELEDTITHVGTVNDSLGGLASVAQTAGRFMAHFDTLFAYAGIGGIVLGLVLFSNVMSRMPLVGNMFRQLTITLLALLVGGASSYAVSRSVSIPEGLKDPAERLLRTQPPERCYFWFRVISCGALITSIPVFLYKSSSNRMSSFSTAISIFSGIFRRRAPQPLQVHPTTQLPPSQPQSRAFTITVSSSAQQARTAYVGNRFLSREAQEDADVRDRINNFQRASTVC